MRGWGLIRRPLFSALRENAFWLHRYWPGCIEEPVFIVGCPRSGTTVLGQVLGRAQDLFYLHEPRHIWCGVIPELDVWGYARPIKEGVLCWDAGDFDAENAAYLAQWLDLERFISLQRRLIEKTPLNVFRLRSLDAAFPTAKFIHLIRHGRDVALSLEAALAEWFPEGYWQSSRHYGIFCDYAMNRADIADKLDLIAEGMGNYPRGLLVWLCSVTEGREAGRELGSEKCLEISYESFVRYPASELKRIFDFLGEPQFNNAVEYAKRTLHMSSVQKSDPDPELTRAIAGDLLAALGYQV